MTNLEGYALPALVLLIKATCLLLVALGASAVLRRASAGSRHLVWLVAVVGVLAMPAVAAWGPLPIRVLPAPGVSGVEAWPVRLAQGDSRARGSSVVTAPSDIASPAATTISTA